MKDREKIIGQLSTLMDESRLKHSIGVSRCASELAKRYGVDGEKAELAGMLHDCAKCLSRDQSVRLCQKHGWEPDSIEQANPSLLHAPLGAFLAEDLFRIRDQEILDAIACHTTGKKGMTLFEKIICLADYMEESRQYPGVEDIRAFAFHDINRALLLAFELSIRNVLDRGKLLHPMTVDARNDLLLAMDGSDKSNAGTSLKNN